MSKIQKKSRVVTKSKIQVGQHALKPQHLATFNFKIVQGKQTFAAKGMKGFIQERKLGDKMEQVAVLTEEAIELAELLGFNEEKLSWVKKDNELPLGFANVSLKDGNQYVAFWSNFLEIDGKSSEGDWTLTGGCAVQDRNASVLREKEAKDAEKAIATAKETPCPW